MKCVGLSITLPQVSFDVFSPARWGWGNPPPPPLKKKKGKQGCHLGAQFAPPPPHPAKPSPHVSLLLYFLCNARGRISKEGGARGRQQTGHITHTTHTVVYPTPTQYTHTSYTHTTPGHHTDTHTHYTLVSHITPTLKTNLLHLNVKLATPTY